MALINATLSLGVDRKGGTFSVLSTSSRVYSQDVNVALNVGGWTLDEVTKTSGKTPYEPYFRIVDMDAVVLAECKLSPDATPTPESDGTYMMRGTLSTNTDKMVAMFDRLGFAPGSMCELSALIYSTTEANPIAVGIVEVYAFDTGTGSAPSNLPSASEVLAQKISYPAGGSVGDVLKKTAVGAEWGQGGSGGTSDYALLTNKPQIGGITLSGNKTASELSLVSANDSRLSDSRTPTLHKNSHKSGQSDAISPADIGAAAAATTLAGYGITDAKIENGKITLGSAEITPLTSHQDISGKVDKESGKGLSTNDYTTAEKTKLAGIYTGATAVSVSATGTATDEVQYITINGTEKKLAGGGGGGGTGNYNDLTNKPQIGGVTLQGNKTIAEIGAIGKSSSIPSLGDDPTEDEVIAALKAIRALCSSN